jgi:hypothetical protein
MVCPYPLWFVAPIQVDDTLITCARIVAQYTCDQGTLRYIAAAKDENGRLVLLAEVRHSEHLGVCDLYARKFHPAEAATELSRTYGVHISMNPGMYIGLMSTPGLSL